MILQIFESELTAIDAELLQLQALLEAKRQKQSLLQQLEEETSATIGTFAQLKTKIQAVSTEAIASLKSAVLNLFDDGNGDGGNQPTDPTPDTDPTGLNDDEPELLCLNGETGDYLTTDDLTDAGETDIPGIKASLTYVQQIKNRCSACWGYSVQSKADIKAGFINRANLSFMGAVNLERKGKEFYETVESYLNKLYYNGQVSQLEECPDSSRTGQYYELASPLVCLLWEDAPLLGQHCPVSFASPTPFVELVKVCDAIAYQKKHDGEILCTYVGFEKKSVAKSWQKFLEPMATNQELRQAQRLQEYQWELKLKGLSLGQIQRLAKEPIGKAYRSDIDSLKPPIVKPRDTAAQPSVEFEQDDIVTPLLTPDGSYKIIQIMPNGILDCENLTTGDRKGLRPGAVSLVERAKKPSQLEIDVDANVDTKPEMYKKYARVKVKEHDFYGQVFPVIKETEQGSTLLTHLGNRWFRSDCLEVIDPDAQTTTDAPVLAAPNAADDGFDF